ncbi:MAG TPA: primase-helicase family protein, partial [Ktedonobacteraceae bacterium]
MEYEFHYSQFPALKAYIDRIGAEQLNFKRFMVKEYHGSHYYVEKVLIKITDDFEIDCNNKEYAPTEEEATAIVDELKKVEFPKSIHAGYPEVEELLATGQVRGQLFVFPDITRKHVIMCQERGEDKNEKKFYVPWTLFKSKGGTFWRRMEPDGKLPFWKPKLWWKDPKDGKYKRNKAHIMVHEGAKTAAFVDNLVNNPEWRDQRRAHPWAEELAKYEHWGAIGGALATHRCDFDELGHINLEGDLVYTCDRDVAGEQAARVFSRMWGKKLYAIKFDHIFREGWDLADPLPEAMFSKTGTVLRQLSSYLDPATWATIKLEKGKKGDSSGRPGYRLTKDFEAEWVHTVNPEMFCHTRLPQKRYDTAAAFNSAVRPFTDVDDTARYLRSSYANKAVTIKYDPSRKPGLFQSQNGNQYVNIYQPWPGIDYTDKEAKHVDYSPWVDFLERLIPNELERSHVMKWAATLISCPGVKMNYGILLVSEMQGVGKTTFADTIAKCLGETNYAYTNENAIISAFNDWAEKQLVVVPEIYQGHSTKAYNQLKEIITDRVISVNRKFVPTYNVDNHVHIIACSNSMRALRLDNTDRRWFVPMVSQVKQTSDYWNSFHDWRDDEDGVRKVRLWAKVFVREHGRVEAGAEAPWTFTKKEMIEENDSPGMEYVRNYFRMFRTMAVTNGGGEISSDSDGEWSKKLKIATREGKP